MDLRRLAPAGGLLGNLLLPSDKAGYVILGSFGGANKQRTSSVDYLHNLRDILGPWNYLMWSLPFQVSVKFPQKGHKNPAPLMHEGAANNIDQKRKHKNLSITAGTETKLDKKVTVITLDGANNF